MQRLSLVPLLFLVACGPIPVAQAERQCLERARLAQQPRGEISVGMSSDGRMAGGLELEISSDFLAGRDPSAVFEACVMQKSGEVPSRSLSQMPGWTG
jgi:hypothetical protein